MAANKTAVASAWYILPYNSNRSTLSSGSVAAFGFLRRVACSHQSGLIRKILPRALSYVTET